MVLGIVIGVAGTITLLYMVVAIAVGIRYLLENAAKIKEVGMSQVIGEKMYTFAATIVVLFMALNILIITCDRLF